jgi:hypothetical protein
MKLLKVRYALLFMTLVSVATAEEKANCHESSLYMIVEGDTGQDSRGKPVCCLKGQLVTYKDGSKDIDPDSIVQISGNLPDSSRC